MRKKPKRHNPRARPAYPESFTKHRESKIGLGVFSKWNRRSDGAPCYRASSVRPNRSRYHSGSNGKGRPFSGKNKAQRQAIGISQATPRGASAGEK